MSRVLDSVRTEVHGDVVITYGRYVGRFKTAAPGRGSSPCGISACTRSVTGNGSISRIERLTGRPTRKTSAKP